MSEEEKPPSGGGNSLLLTVSVMTPVVLAVLGPMWYHFVMDEGGKEAALALLVKNGIPASCFESSPPSSACVNQAFPWLIGGFTAVMVAYTIKTLFFDKPSQAILDVIEQEFDKRHEVLQGLLQELDAGFVADEEDDDIELFNTEVLWERVRALIELPNYKKETGKEGFRWLWIVLQKELRVALKLTKGGEDVKFASGKKLQSTLDAFDEMIVRGHSQGFGPTGDQKKKLYKLRWEAVYYLKTHGFKTVMKAIKMALFAKEAFPWLVLQTIGNTSTAMLVPLKLFYRAQVLENLGDTEGEGFWEASKAMILVELLSTVLELLTDMVKVQAETLANKEIQIKYYDGLLKMPVTFWSRQADMGWDDQINFYSVYTFGWSVTSFLEIPQNVLQQMVQAITYAYIILNTSSKSLLFLLGAQFGSSILLMLMEIVTRRLNSMSQQGIIKESEEDFECCWYSLNPDFISTFLSFVRGPQEIKRFEKMKTAEAEMDKRRNFVKVFSSPVNSVVSQGSQVAQFSTARTNVLQQGLGIADADAMVRSAENFVEQTQLLGGMFGDVIEKATPLAKAYDIITIPRTIDPDKGLWPKERAKGRIEFKDVRFKYPRRDAEVLKGVTFTVQPGDTIGMTGSAGCGKSTCMRLLERFYDVSAGSVLLDGIDIREYNPRWLRSQIATVAQEPKLVPITIRENLTFGCTKEPSLDEIYDALKAANIYDSIMDKSKFPQGLRTSIESAGNVSGGEKQRIAIARAILADPPILLLDEATSALDEENQAKVQEALDALMKGRTTMVIAHRLSTIKNSSKIVAFDKGKVFEEGKHEDLLNTEGSLYRKLWNRQTSKKIGDEDEEEEEEEKEEEAIEPLAVEAGMNPKPSGLKRLETLLQDIEDTDPMKKELKKVCEMLEKEQESREVRKRGITRNVLQKWQHHATKSSATHQSAGTKNFQRLANKVVFKNLHSSTINKLDSMGGDDDK